MGTLLLEGGYALISDNDSSVRTDNTSVPRSSFATRFVDRLASGELPLWRIVFLYDLLARFVFAIPLILLKEATASSTAGALALILIKFTLGGAAMIYFGACILGAYRSLRKGENGKLMAVFGGLYVVVQGLLYIGGIAQLLTSPASLSRLP